MFSDNTLIIKVNVHCTMFTQVIHRILTNSRQGNNDQLKTQCVYACTTLQILLVKIFGLPLRPYQGYAVIFCLRRPEFNKFFCETFWSIFTITMVAWPAPFPSPATPPRTRTAAACDPRRIYLGAEKIFVWSQCGNHHKRHNSNFVCTVLWLSHIRQNEIILNIFFLNFNLRHGVLSTKYV